ncbi:MAG TPA: hypothetical protein PLT70_06225 [bacterium]|nr:hypothetical protein [bacterium]
MEKFYFIQYPEQIFPLKQNIEDIIPVIPVYEDLADFGRIISSIKRWGRPAAVFYERTLYPLKQFLEKSGEFDSVFTIDADVVKALRETGFNGKIYLFSNFRMLVHNGFFNDFRVIPVVSGKANYDLAKNKGLEPVYFVSDKICVADFGLCISRKSDPQCFYNCDNRCREKSISKQGLEFPLSMKPETIYPEKTSYLGFSEKLQFPNVKQGELRDQVLERSWNYRFPLGIEILKPGKTGNGKNYTFPLDRKSAKLFEKGLIEFYGYSGSIYKGRWIKSAKAKLSADDKLSVSIGETYQNVLMVQRYADDEKDLLKRARHFIFTLPEKKLLDKIEEEPESIEPVKQGPVRKYSGKTKLTLITDDIKKFHTFKGRDIERKVLIYKRGVPAGFPEFLFIAGAINDYDFEDISHMRKLKGIVVPDGIMKAAFERLFPEKEIVLHPMSYYDPSKSPSFLSASTTIFVSRFKSEKRNDYGWNDINIFLRNQPGFTEFISRKKLSRHGGRKELWVNIADITDDALKYLKSQAELIVRKVR